MSENTAAAGEGGTGADGGVSAAGGDGGEGAVSGLGGQAGNGGTGGDSGQAGGGGLGGASGTAAGGNLAVDGSGTATIVGAALEDGNLAPADGGNAGDGGDSGAWTSCPEVKGPDADQGDTSGSNAGDPQSVCNALEAAFGVNGYVGGGGVGGDIPAPSATLGTPGPTGTAGTGGNGGIGGAAGVGGVEGAWGAPELYVATGATASLDTATSAVLSTDTGSGDIASGATPGNDGAAGAPGTAGLGGACIPATGSVASECNGVPGGAEGSPGAPPTPPVGETGAPPSNAQFAALAGTNGLGPGTVTTTEAPSAPGRPQPPTVATGPDGNLDVSWTAPEDSSDPSIADFYLTATYTDGTTSVLDTGITAAPGTTVTYPIVDGLSASSGPVNFRVQALGSGGLGLASQPSAPYTGAAPSVAAPANGPVDFTVPQWIDPVGTPVDLTVATATGTPAPAVSAQVGTNLPPGMTLSNDGNGDLVLSGTPTAPGTYSIPIVAINAFDGDNGPSVENFQLVVVPPPTSPPTITASPALASPPVIDATSGEAMQSQQFSTTAVPVDLTESGDLPTGVTFSLDDTGTGTLSGTPDAAGTYDIELTSADAVGPPATQEVVLDVAPGPTSASMHVSPSSSVTSTTDTTVSATITPSPDGGTVDWLDTDTSTGDVSLPALPRTSPMAWRRVRTSRPPAPTPSPPPSVERPTFKGRRRRRTCGPMRPVRPGHRSARCPLRARPPSPASASPTPTCPSSSTTRSPSAPRRPMPSTSMGRGPTAC